MVLPLLLIMVLPKLMNAADPEAQKVKRKSQWKLCCCKNNQGCILQNVKRTYDEFVNILKIVLKVMW